MWLQSMDDGDIAFPVMTPDIIMPDYKPTVNEELLAPLGDLNEENMYVIVTVNVPSDITNAMCIPGLFASGNSAQQTACSSGKVVIDSGGAGVSINGDISISGSISCSGSVHGTNI